VVCESEEEQESEWQTSSPLWSEREDELRKQRNLKKIQINSNEIHKIFEIEMFIEMKGERRLQNMKKK